MCIKATAALFMCCGATYGQVWLEEVDWTFQDTAQGTGWVDPFIGMMYVEGGDAGLAGSTGFAAIAPAAGTVGVTLAYSSQDVGPFDASWFQSHDDLELIADNDGQGTYQLFWEVAEGETFGFNVSTQDGVNGAGVLEVVDFALLPSFDAEPCAADFNGDGHLDILDFVAFQGAFLAGDDAADCNGSGTLDVLDFVCFQGAFELGCEGPRHKALVIINSKWDHACKVWVSDQNGEPFEDLQSATMDGQNMAAAMRDAGLEVEILQNANADQIAAKIKECMPVGDDGTLTIYITGHGDANDALPGSPGKGALICHDCSFLTHDMFVEAVKDRPKQVATIMGSCGSGAFGKEVNSKQPFRQKTGFYTSTTDNTVCFGTPGVGGHFTVALLNTLNDDQTDGNDNGRVSLGESVRPTRQAIPDAWMNARGPNPNLSNLTFVDMGPITVPNTSEIVARKVTITFTDGPGYSRPRIVATPVDGYVESMVLEGNTLSITFTEPVVNPGDELKVGIAAAGEDGIGLVDVVWE